MACKRKRLTSKIHEVKHVQNTILEVFEKRFPRVLQWSTTGNVIKCPKLSLLVRVGTRPEYPGPVTFKPDSTRPGPVNFETPTNRPTNKFNLDPFLLYTYQNTGPARAWPCSNSATGGQGWLAVVYQLGYYQFPGSTMVSFFNQSQSIEVILKCYWSAAIFLVEHLLSRHSVLSILKNL